MTERKTKGGYLSADVRVSEMSVPEGLFRPGAGARKPAPADVWVVEIFDHSSDDSRAVGHATDEQVARAYVAKLEPLVPVGSGVRCYSVPLLGEAPEPFIGFGMIGGVDLDGRILPLREHPHLVLALDGPEADDYPAEPAVRVWESGEDGSAAGRDHWSVVGAGRDLVRLEHACRLKIAQILNYGRTERGHWRNVGEFTCPECSRLAGWDCDFGKPGEIAVGFHQARVEAMKTEARRLAAVWREQETPLWAEFEDAGDGWWERGARVARDVPEDGPPANPRP